MFSGFAAKWGWPDSMRQCISIAQQSEPELSEFRRMTSSSSDIGLAVYRRLNATGQPVKPAPQFLAGSPQITA